MNDKDYYNIIAANLFEGWNDILEEKGYLEEWPEETSAHQRVVGPITWQYSNFLSVLKDEKAIESVRTSWIDAAIEDAKDKGCTKIFFGEHRLQPYDGPTHLMIRFMYEFELFK